jgi:cryptochrome
LGIEDEGFFQIEYPLPQPSQLKPLPSLKVFSPTGPPDPLRSYSPDELTELLPASLKAEVRSRNSYFPGGETEALARLQRKVSGKVDFVNNFRKPKTASTNESGNPMEPSTTGLSPYLSTGCLSVRMLWKECEKSYRLGNHSEPPESLHGQLLFREMFYLLSRSVKNWDRDSENEMCKPIAWDELHAEKMTAWEKGQTGFPLIDAMMRQLDATGWMHHLGRHAVSCFLTRGQLWQNWMFGRDVFDKKLVDSDWALNNGNWLWLSGVAPFSMPYFRLYNPCPDAKSSLNVETKFAQFIKFWVPELKHFPPKYVYEPHLAPPSVQSDSKCIIGKDFPHPIVDRKQSAKENLTKFKDSLGRKS